MVRKNHYLFFVAIMVVALAACSSIKLPGASATPQAGQQGQQPDFGNMPIEGKLAIGTLSLEGTGNAVTAEQAKDLLPLWKAVKMMSASNSASPQEIDALYKQIQETMTEQQVQAIKDMSMKPEDTQALMEKYGVKMPQMSQRPTMDANMQATRQAARSSQSGQGGTGGGMPGGGMPGGGMPGGGGFPGGEMPGGGTTGMRGTPQVGQARPGGMRGDGMNTMFVEPLIQLLTERAGG